MVKIYKQPFAHGGDTIAIPDASQPDGKMSSADGWTPDYQLPKTDPNYKPVGRQEMNGVFKEVTEALGQVQVQGAASWSPDGAPYPINAQVYHNGKQWIALRDNSVEPVEGADWKGALRPATPEQARELTDGDVAITPETLGSAMNAHVLGMGQTWKNVTASRAANTIYTNATGRPIMVAARATLNAPVTGRRFIALTVGDVNVMTVDLSGTTSNGNNGLLGVDGVVPAGVTYSVTTDGAGLVWMELR